MKTNYHTHTERCKHATGSDEEFVLSALQAGFDEIGFSDHSPWPYASGFQPRVRMEIDELSGYVRSIRALQEKYRDRISIRLGLECEYFETYIPWLQSMIREEGLDYVIFGNHFYGSDEYSEYFGHCIRDRKMLYRYLESALQGIDSGLFACMAHPDLFMKAYPGFDDACADVSREICRAAAEKGLLLEYNISGYDYSRLLRIDGFPHRKFWEIAAEFGCRAIIGYDAHDHRQLESDAERNRALRELQALHIPVADQLPFL